MSQHRQVLAEGRMQYLKMDSGPEGDLKCEQLEFDHPEWNPLAPLTPLLPHPAMLTQVLAQLQ